LRRQQRFKVHGRKPRIADVPLARQVSVPCCFRLQMAIISLANHAEI